MEALPDQVMADAETLWNFHRIDDDLRPASVGIGLGSHDLGVATYTADLYHQGLFPLIVFSGANAPTTRELFPRGEAVHYAEHARALGVPASSIQLDTNATSTPENIRNSQEVLQRAGIRVNSVILICRPYQQRRVHGIAQRQWPNMRFMVTGQRISLTDYFDQIQDRTRVLNMIVGDTQRLELDAATGYAANQAIPESVRLAYERLRNAGYDRRIIGLP